MTLEELGRLDLASPAAMHRVDAAGRVHSFTAHVTGEYPSRRLRAMHEISLLLEGSALYHPQFWACDAGDVVWLLTTNGNGGRLTLTPTQAHLDDGFGRALHAWPQSTSPDEVTLRAARFLHAEIAGEQACQTCGCTESWACEDGCASAAPGLCTGCANPLSP